MIILQQIASLEQTLRSETVTGRTAYAVVDPFRARPSVRSIEWVARPSLRRRRMVVRARWRRRACVCKGSRSGACRSDRCVARPRIGISCRDLRRFGEPIAARTFATEARALSSRVDWNKTVDDERFGLLLLAEVFAKFDPAGATEILAGFDAIKSSIGMSRVQRGGDARLRGWNAYVRASVAQSHGDVAVAASLFAVALGAFRSCGYRWREAQTLVALADLPPAVRTDTVAAPLDEAVALVARHFPKAFIARRFDGWARVYVDARGQMLSPAQREVLRWL